MIISSHWPWFCPEFIVTLILLSERHSYVEKYQNGSKLNLGLENVIKVNNVRYLPLIYTNFLGTDFFRLVLDKLIMCFIPNWVHIRFFFLLSSEKNPPKYLQHVRIFTSSPLENQLYNYSSNCFTYCVSSGKVLNLDFESNEKMSEVWFERYMCSVIDLG